MYWQQPLRRQLLRLAVITSPLLALVRVAPVAILTRDEFKEMVAADERALLIGVLAPLVITVSIFLLWLFNIWLFTKHIEDPKVVRERRKKVHFYIYSFLLAMTFLFPSVIVEYFVDPELLIRRPNNLSFYPLLGTLANNAVILLIINLMLTRDSENRLALSNMQLEVNSLMAQQAQLKHQLQPHFLFNALYTLQLLIGKDADKAKRYLQRLSSFLRQSIQYARQDTIGVKEELQFCEDYLALQQVRFGDALTYTIDMGEAEQRGGKSIAAKGGKLPIFALQVLAENAIKHNAFDAEQPLRIVIKACDDNRLMVENNMLPKREIASDSNGFGLSNLSERYRLLASDELTIESSEEDKMFRVYVPILFK